MPVIEGVPPANRKPENPIHKVHKTTRMFIGVLQGCGPLPANRAAAYLSPISAVLPQD
jgi:hypothetical protein